MPVCRCERHQRQNSTGAVGADVGCLDVLLLAQYYVSHLQHLPIDCLAKLFLVHALRIELCLQTHTRSICAGECPDGRGSPPSSHSHSPARVSTAELWTCSSATFSFIVAACFSVLSLPWCSCSRCLAVCPVSCAGAHCSPNRPTPGHAMHLAPHSLNAAAQGRRLRLQVGPAVTDWAGRYGLGRPLRIGPAVTDWTGRYGLGRPLRAQAS